MTHKSNISDIEIEDLCKRLKVALTELKNSHGNKIFLAESETALEDTAIMINDLKEDPDFIL